MINAIVKLFRSDRAGTIIPQVATYMPLAPTMDIKVKDHAEDPPKFRMTYTTVIINGIKVSVDARNGYFNSGRQYSGELTQPDGRYILFDPERIADKILDRELLPRIQAAVDAMIKEDKRFLQSLPTWFKDAAGVTWSRA